MSTFGIRVAFILPFYLLIAFLTPTAVFAQNIHEDTKVLTRAFYTNDANLFYETVAKYTIGYGSAADKELIKQELAETGNRVLLQYSNLLDMRIEQRAQAQQSFAFDEVNDGKNPEDKSLADEPIPVDEYFVNPQMVADGLSKFIVSRVKEEVIVTFFDRLQRDFEKWEELPVLFPNTNDYISVLDDQSVGLMLEVLRDAFKKDLNQIPTRVPRLAAIPKYKKAINSQPRLKTTLATASMMMYLIENRDNPSEIIDRVSKLSYVNSDDRDKLGRSLNILAFVSNSLMMPPGSEKEWLSKDELKRLESTPSAPMLFMGLAFQRYGKSVKDFEVDTRFLPQNKQAVRGGSSAGKKGATSLGALMSSYELEYNTRSLAPRADSIAYAPYHLFKPYYHRFLGLGDKIGEQALKMKRQRSRGYTIDPRDVRQYVDLVINLFEYALVDKTFGSPNGEQAPTFLKVAPALLEMRSAIKEKRYGSAIVYLNLMLAHSVSESWEGGAEKEILKYGLFIANVANAESSDEVHAAIEAAALPSGSSSIKRRSDLNISINTYAGPFIANEVMLNRAASEQNAFSAGLMAPLGIAVSKGGRWGAVSLYTTLIDVGALVSFRFNDSDAEMLPEFKLQNIVSPGVHLIYGIPNLPISVGGGLQFGPQLREVTIDNATITSSAYRSSIFVAVDIPLFNIYTKPN